MPPSGADRKQDLHKFNDFASQIRRNLPQINRKFVEKYDLLQLTLDMFPLQYRSSAGIAQLVEHNLAKVGVASSSLVSRSRFQEARPLFRAPGFFVIIGVP